MEKRYDMQRFWNEGRKDLASHSLETQFVAITQCLFDMSETLALIYDKICETPVYDQSDDSYGLPI